MLQNLQPAFQCAPQSNRYHGSERVDGIDHMLNHFKYVSFSIPLKKALIILEFRYNMVFSWRNSPSPVFVCIARELNHTHVHMQLKFTGSFLHSFVYQRINFLFVSHDYIHQIQFILLNAQLVSS